MSQGTLPRNQSFKETGEKAMRIIARRSASRVEAPKTYPPK